MEERDEVGTQTRRDYNNEDDVQHGLQFADVIRSDRSMLQWKEEWKLKRANPIIDLDENDDEFEKDYESPSKRQCTATLQINWDDAVKNDQVQYSVDVRSIFRTQGNDSTFNDMWTLQRAAPITSEDKDEEQYHIIANTQHTSNRESSYESSYSLC